MAFENIEQAAEALAAAVSGSDTPEQTANLQAAGEGAPAPYANQPVEAPSTTQGELGDQGSQVAPEAPQADQQPVEEFTPSKDIDLSGLTDEQREFLQAREREMQAHFTQRTQELSQAQREAEQAIQFVNELNTNPYFAAEIVADLSMQLQQAGFSPAQADQMALGQAQQMAQGQQPTMGQPQDLGFEEGFVDDDPYLSEIEKLRGEFGQVRQYLDAQAEQQRVASLEAQLNNQVAYVQSTHPDWNDADLAKVVNMAYAYNGDITRAASEYEAVQQAAIERYMNRKETVTSPAVLPQGGSAQAAPEKFDSLEDPRLEAAAIRRLNEALGQ